MNQYSFQAPKVTSMVEEVINTRLKFVKDQFMARMAQEFQAEMTKELMNIAIEVTERGGLDPMGPRGIVMEVIIKGEK